LLAKLLQAITHQPGAIAEVVLQVLLERLEVGVTQRAAEAPDAGFADAQLGGDARRRLERQLVQVGEHVAGDLAARGGSAVEAAFQALLDRLAHAALRLISGVGRKWLFSVIKSIFDR
jgi:hypothetical protein